MTINRPRNQPCCIDSCRLPLSYMYLSRNQRVHGTVEADTAGEFSFDHVPEGVYSVDVEEQGYLKAVQADVRVVLRRVANVQIGAGARER